MDYKQFRTIPQDYLKSKIKEFLLEDIPEGDITSDPIFSDDMLATAKLQAQQKLILAGKDIIATIFKNIADIKIFFEDGDIVQENDVIAEIKGPANEILRRERVMLNLLQRTCGIATFANELAKIAHPYSVKILDTRKTTPGLRLFEKFAVAVGGAANHRFDLSSGVLIKDNHIEAAGSITNAINKIRQSTNHKIEIEVENFDQLDEALKANADGFLLDNMSPETVRKAVEIIRNSKRGKELFIEASGGITEKSLLEYVKTGIDAVSIGAITHSVKSADMHLEFT